MEANRHRRPFPDQFLAVVDIAGLCMVYLCQLHLVAVHHGHTHLPFVARLHQRFNARIATSGVINVNKT